MILRILLTLAVIAAVYAWFRAQKSKQENHSSLAQGRIVVTEPAENNWVKPVFYSLGGLTILAGISIYYFSWLDDQTLFQIKVTNPQTGAVEIFTAHKKDMNGRQFTTETGQNITLSDMERIEVKKLDSE